MAQTSYPGQLDSDVELPRVDDNITEIGGDAINSLRDAIFSIESAIGVNPQGNMADLVARINGVIDEDGNIRSSAISSIGLVTLPISNLQIDYAAGIEESKLDLDYSTVSLNASISSVENDVSALRDSNNILSSRMVTHFSGTGNYHDGYDISLEEGVRGQDTVEAGLHGIDNALIDHIILDDVSHTAESISADNTFNNFSATNVQDALEQLDEVAAGNLETHQDILHVNGIGLNSRGEQGTQGNLKETVLASTIYQTNIAKATNILQVMRPNVARVTSNNLNLRALDVGAADTLRVLAGDMDTYLDISLSAIIPTEDLDLVVSTINSSAHSDANHYPISAYNTDGKLTIAHNIPGDEFTIQILNTNASPAASALGFTDVIATTFYWSRDEYVGYVGGKKIDDLKSLIKIHYEHTAAPLNQLSLGLGDLRLYGLAIDNDGRVLCNITNHSSDTSYHGTYFITSFPDSGSFTLNADIALGEFDIEVVSDSVNFQNSANGEIHDIFLEVFEDGYGEIIKQKRIAYGILSGISLRSVSKDFPLSGMSYQVTAGSSIQVLEGALAGTTVSIPAGYLGTLEVLAPDNVNYAVFEVHGSPASGTRSITVYSYYNSEDSLYLSSVHYSGNFGIYTLKYVTDRRLLGTSVDNISRDSLAPTLLEDALEELRNNGVVRGLDVISTSSASFKLRGGRILVNGRMISIKTQDITVDDFSESTRLLIADSTGRLIIKDETDAGYTFVELIEGDGYGDYRGVVPIVEFETDGAAFGAFTDRRLFVNNIDRRLLDVKTDVNQRIDALESVINGSMWGFTVSSGDNILAEIDTNSHDGMTYVPSYVGWWDQDENDAWGFLDGQTVITTRIFEITDVPDYDNSATVAKSVFKAPGLTHINVFAELEYTGVGGGPFGVSGSAYIDLGVGVNTGTLDGYSNAFARVKDLTTGVLPADSVTERYVVSIPVSHLNLTDDTLFDITMRVRVINSNYIDGGSGVDADPLIKFGLIRIVTSSYSIAGNIESLDGSDSAIASKIGEVL